MRSFSFLDSKTEPALTWLFQTGVIDGRIVVRIEMDENFGMLEAATDFELYAVGDFVRVVEADVGTENEVEFDVSHLS